MRRWLQTRPTRLLLFALFAWFAETAWRLRGDTCYDLRNYHLYDPFALLHGKAGIDIAPAQSQSFLPPANDLPYYLLARHVGDVHWLNLLLALPAAVAAGLALLITLRLLHARTWTDRLLAFVAVLIGATGAAGHPVLATSMSDMLPASLVLAAILLILRQADRAGVSAAGAGTPKAGAASAVPNLPTPALPAPALPTPALPTPAAADPARAVPHPAVPARRASAVPARLLPGLLVGTALGLKLTFSYAAGGLAVALLVWSDRSPALRLRACLLFICGTLLGTVAVCGWWWLHLWRISGNPLFPYYNNLFRSPLAWPGDFVDRRFFPRDLLHWLFYPFFWAVRRTPLVTEADEPMRDPRIALALLAAIALLAFAGRGRRRGGQHRVRQALRCQAPIPDAGPQHFLAVFFLVSYAMWEREFSIFRYLALLELLSGPVLVLAACRAARTQAARRLALGGAVLLLALLRIYTVDPNWGRLPHEGGRPIAVSMPQLAAGSVVLILDSAPLAYLALFEPAGVRFIGTNNNLTQPQGGGPMQQRIRDAIAARRGPLYGLEDPGFERGRADQTLAAYRLHRAGCVTVRGNIVGATTRLCRLRA